MASMWTIYTRQKKQQERSAMNSQRDNRGLQGFLKEGIVHHHQEIGEYNVRSGFILEQIFESAPPTAAPSGNPTSAPTARPTTSQPSSIDTNQPTVGVAQSIPTAQPSSSAGLVGPVTEGPTAEQPTSNPGGGEGSPSSTTTSSPTSATSSNTAPSAGPEGSSTVAPTSAEGSTGAPSAQTGASSPNPTRTSIPTGTAAAPSSPTAPSIATPTGTGSTGPTVSSSVMPTVSEPLGPTAPTPSLPPTVSLAPTSDSSLNAPSGESGVPTTSGESGVPTTSGESGVPTTSKSSTSPLEMPSVAPTRTGVPTTTLSPTISTSSPTLTSRPSTTSTPTTTVRPTRTLGPSLSTSSPTTTARPTRTAAPSVATLAPTVTQRPTTTSTPSQTPVTVSPTLTGQPTAEGGEIEEQQNLVSDCAIDTEGFYGSDIGVEHDLDYAYEVVVESGVSVGQTRDVVIPLIEAAIGNMLLPKYFPEECDPAVIASRLSNQTMTTRRRRLQLEYEDLNGVSLLPADLILLGVPCVGDVPASNLCFVVDGGMTMYLVEQPENATHTLDLMYGSIVNAMDAGDYNGMENVVIVRSRERGSLSEAERSEPTGTAEPSSLPIYGWIFVGMGIILFCIMIVCCVLVLRGNSPTEGRRSWGEESAEDFYAGANANSFGGDRSVPKYSASFDDISEEGSYSDEEDGEDDYDYSDRQSPAQSPMIAPRQSPMMSPSPMPASVEPRYSSSPF